MITSCITLLPIDNPHAVAVDIGIALKPIPVRDNVMELDVVAIITNISNDFSIIVIVFCFFFLFRIVIFFFKVSNQFFNVVYVVIKTVNIVFFSFLIFVQDQYFFLMVHFGLIYHIFGPFI